jgi:uncharacterized protein YecT (DUF1311 family)
LAAARKNISTIRFIGLGLAVLWSPYASALDCATASSPVEQAICAEPSLKAADTKLSERYFSALSRAKIMAGIIGQGSVHDRLLKSQRAFISLREKDCVAGGPEGIKRCIADETATRLADLDRLNQYGPDAPGETLALRDYKLGGETITVAEDPQLPNQKTVRYKGSELLSGEDLWVVDVWTGGDVTAMLVESYDGGTEQCRSVYIIETHQLGVVKAIHLDKGCAYGPRWAFRRTARGFAFETQAQPLDDGMIVEWNATTGTVAKRPTKFFPESGLTMEGLLRLDRPQYRDPLTSAEFYRAVQALPSPDRTRAMQALSNIGDACDCNSDDRLNLYGAQVEPDLAAYSACGWYLRASVVRCQDTDALAVWDRKTAKAYFAVDDHIVGGLHTKSPGLRLYPAHDQWPARAVAKLDAWMAGAVWNPEMSDRN